MRVAGSAELGGALEPHERRRPGARCTRCWTTGSRAPPGCRRRSAGRARGRCCPTARRCSAPAALPGVWLNLGHGSSGWALACGSARVLADLMARTRASHRHRRARAAAAEALIAPAVRRCRTMRRSDDLPCPRRTAARPQRILPGDAPRLARRAGLARDRGRSPGAARRRTADAACRPGRRPPGAGGGAACAAASGWPAGPATTAATGWWRPRTCSGAGIDGAGHAARRCAARCPTTPASAGGARSRPACRCRSAHRTHARRPGRSTRCWAWARRAHRRARSPRPSPPSTRMRGHGAGGGPALGPERRHRPARWARLRCAPRTRCRC